jgi:hypothetical protein
VCVVRSGQRGKARGIQTKKQVRIKYKDRIREEKKSCCGREYLSLFFFVCCVDRGPFDWPITRPGRPTNRERERQRVCVRACVCVSCGQVQQQTFIPGR